ncbi:MAG TPA: alkaline phosphatase family protein [Chthonomonadaceae bacterium]|nr:alkaline phosphatase family protein [Chthonomonadaceae bacterium]
MPFSTVRPVSYVAATISLALGGVALAICPGPAGAQTEPLVTGKRIAPAGDQQNVGSLPMNLILTPDQRYAICSDMGYRQALTCLDARTGKTVSRIDFRRAGTEGLYYGLAAVQRGGETHVFASLGADAGILAATVGPDGALAKTGTLSLKPGDLAAGIDVDRRGYLYVAINEFSLKAQDIREMTTPGALAVLDTRTGAEIGRYRFGNQLSNFPFAVATLRDGSRVYVTSQRDGTVTALDTTDPASIKLVDTIATGSHPIALCLNGAQSRLYVANAHSDTVSVVDTTRDRVVATVPLRPRSLGSFAGATPTGLALSADERTLYVSLGDMNAVAVVSLARNAVAGFIPAGWYPSAVAATKEGRLLWTNAKGTQLRNPNGKPAGPDGGYGTYSLSVLEGGVATMPAPDRAALAEMTRQTIANNSRQLPAGAPANPLASIGLKAGKIKHVIYIVKENRTYDQVLGDLTDESARPVGNGDSSLTMFGKEVTPNLHALALRFVTLDNFYDCGEVSGDGWTWSTQGMASEYTIKNVPYNYAGRGRQYDFEGQNNGYPVGGFPAAGPDGKPLVSKSSPLYPSAKPVPDVNGIPAGHIWDAVLRSGLSIRNYGFFLTFGVKAGGELMLPDNYPSVQGLQPAGHDLAGRSDYDFLQFNLNYPDSDAPRLVAERRAAAGTPGPEDALYPMRAYGKHNAPSRFAEWNTEFQQMLAKAPDGSAVPNFMMIRFMADHTQGVGVGRHTPDSYVADNDYAVGQLVEAVSHSPVWESTAIFVIEDDAQNGQDHVDCHRSTCYVISPWIRAHSVDHGFYNTDSVLRSMELLLGVQPLSQYDAIAGPILDWDTAPSNREPYRALLPDEAIIAKRTVASSREAPLSKLTARLDFVHPDSADPEILNAILWKYAKGMNAVPPPPRHSPALAPARASTSHAKRKIDKDND